MLFGINLGGGTLPHESRSLAMKSRLTKAYMAKKYGFQSIWSGAGYLNNDFHPMLLLSRAAAEAPGLELGMVALLPLYHPVEAAEQIATLDVISEGRFILAPALGWRDFQFNAFEIPKTDRLSRFSEVTEIMKLLWTEEKINHTGKHFRLNDIPGGGKPLQNPYPKMYLAANQDRGVKRAARNADGWLISSRATLTTIKDQIPTYQAELDKQEKSGYISAWREMFIAETRLKAIEICRPHVEWLYKDRAASGHNQELPSADRIDVSFEEVLKERFIIGSPDECADEIKKYQDLGVKELILRCQWPGMPPDQSNKAMELFGKEVIPRFQ